MKSHGDISETARMNGMQPSKTSSDGCDRNITGQQHVR